MKKNVETPTLNEVAQALRVIADWRYTEGDVSNVMFRGAQEIESMTAERDRLRKALELAANRLYEEGAPHSYVDDAREVLAGRDPY